MIHNTILINDKLVTVTDISFSFFEPKDNIYNIEIVSSYMLKLSFYDKITIIYNNNEYTFKCNGIFQEFDYKSENIFFIKYNITSYYMYDTTDGILQTLLNRKSKLKKLL